MAEGTAGPGRTDARWLQQVDPRAEPSGFGMWSWAATRLVVESLQAIGPAVTRDRLQAHLQTVHGLDAGGLVPPQDIGRRRANDCMIILEVRDGAFHRDEPSPGWRCDRQVPMG